MVTVAAVEAEQTAHAITLCSKLDKAEPIDGTQYISIDLVSFADAKSKDEKAAMVANVFKGSLIKKKSFVGYTIDSLYSFFMLFVVMAGIASVILFFLSKKLVKMMNGVV